VQLSLALLFLLTLPLWRAVPERTARDVARAHGLECTPTATAGSVAGWLSAGIFALYVAVEITTGVWAGSILVVARGFTPVAAGFCAAAFYASITGGRILVGLVVDRWGNRRLVATGLALAFAATLGFAFASTVPLAAATLVALGLGFAPVYPCLMHEVPRRFAPEAVQTVIGRQSGAANLGAAVLPSAAGWLAEFSLEGIVWVVAAGIVGLAAAVRRLNRLA
jgi:MFS family permease